MCDMGGGFRPAPQITKGGAHRSQPLAVINHAQHSFRPRFGAAQFKPCAMTRIIGNPRQQFRHLAHVVLGIACTDAQRMQFHHLARQIFVQALFLPLPLK